MQTRIFVIYKSSNTHILTRKKQRTNLVTIPLTELRAAVRWAYDVITTRSSPTSFADTFMMRAIIETVTVSCTSIWTLIYNKSTIKAFGTRVASKVAFEDNY